MKAPPPPPSRVSPPPSPIRSFERSTRARYFDFGKYTHRTRSVRHLLRSLDTAEEYADDLGSGGGENHRLAHIAEAVVIFVPLARASLTAALWVLPLPQLAHIALGHCHEALSIFSNHDVFALALGLVAYEVGPGAGSRQT